MRQTKQIISLAEKVLPFSKNSEKIERMRLIREVGKLEAAAEAGRVEGEGG